jgi:twitching motility two-component system response regulator PilG
MIEIGLGQKGYEVVCCFSGEHALRWLASPNACIPDLILVDLCLPEMGGYSVIRFLRSRSILVALPVVIISRRGGFIDVLRGKLVGANTHLSKPFEIDHLLCVVQGYLGVPSRSVSVVS